MKIALKMATLHAPLFLAGTNLTDKLDTKARRGLILEYDRSEKELHVTWTNGGGDQETGILPISNVAAMVPVDHGWNVAQRQSAPPITAIMAGKVEEIDLPDSFGDLAPAAAQAMAERQSAANAPIMEHLSGEEPAPKRGPGRPPKPVTAQVATPQSHVHAGPGAGLK